MTWRCPACLTVIRHEADLPLPQSGAVYRCHVCRLELVIDPDTQKLMVAPLDDPPTRTRKTDHA